MSSLWSYESLRGAKDDEFGARTGIQPVIPMFSLCRITQRVDVFTPSVSNAYTSFCLVSPRVVHQTGWLLSGRVQVQGKANPPLLWIVKKPIGSRLTTVYVREKKLTETCGKESHFWNGTFSLLSGSGSVKKKQWRPCLAGNCTFKTVTFLQALRLGATPSTVP